REAADRDEMAIFTGLRVRFDTQVISWDPATAISGVVFHDMNGDGLRQLGEEGLAGIPVTAAFTQRVLTDHEGRFHFKRVWGKAIPVHVELASLPAGYVLSTSQVQVVRPAAGPPPALLFGALGRGEVRGRVFYDVDGDGRYSAADRGLEGVRFRLDSRTAQTDRSGWCFFRDLPGGRYTVTLILDSLPLRYLPMVPVRRQIELVEAGTVTLDMPVTVRRVIEGQVYLDENDNRRLDLSEEALQGMPICVDGRRVVTTDVRGKFRVPEPSAGSHQLVLNCGMPLKELLPLSSDQPTISIGPDDPETITVDFRLIRKETLLRERIRERRRATEKVTEL
ncbi:MAG: hypothetical protein Q8R91_02280, partial [Candidatus Omnitrophota bacterium]|nr:hypothetical protein [Candidatus Omnitrophota bacterium]